MSGSYKISFRNIQGARLKWQRLSVPPARRGNGQSGSRDEQDEARDHFQELLEITAQINGELLEKGIPVQLYVHSEMGEVFIDLARTDGSGRVLEILHRNITHSEFSAILESLERGEGFMVDSTG